MARNNFGNQVAGSSSVYASQANNKVASQFTNNTGTDLLVDQLVFNWLSIGSTTKVRGFIYSDSGGLPANLLGSTPENPTMRNGWNILTFSTPVLVPAGATIWAGVMSNVDVIATNCIPSGITRYNANTYASGPSATFGASSSVAFTYRMFLCGEDTTQSFGRRSIDITSIASGDGNYQPDREHVDRAVLGGTETVHVTSISTYIRNTSATVKSKAAIYSDNAGYPGTKLAQTEEVIGSTANTWMTLAIPGGVDLAPGIYWLAFVSSENLTTPVIPYTGYLIVDGPLTEASAWPANYPVGTPPTIPPIVLNPVTDGRGIDIYASYEAYVPPPEPSGSDQPLMMMIIG